MLLKESHHQAYLEDRAKRALGQSTSTIRVRPIAIGDALLRIAERAYTKSMGSAWQEHLMPFQVGVNMPGGMNSWSTNVEAHMQLFPEDIMVSIDLENCFNAPDCDALIEACLSCQLTAPLARYVATTYPGGMQVLLNVLGDWRRIPFERV